MLFSIDVAPGFRRTESGPIMSAPTPPITPKTTDVSRPLSASPREDAPATDVLDVLVVGAGQAGLAVGYHLRSTGLRFQLLDRHTRVGDSWRQRYDSLVLFTPRRFSALPGLILSGDPEGYPGKDEVADYLEAYAARFDLPVRLGVEVQTLERIDDTFVATVGDGSVANARTVVIAAGAHQVPSIPAMAAGFSSDVAQMPASEYRNAAGVRDGTVLVVGDGATGRQIAQDLSERHHVLLAHGRSRRVTRDRILGQSVFWWLDRLGLLRVSGSSFIGRRLRAADPFPAQDRHGRALVEAGVRLVPRLVEARGATARFADDAEEQIDTVIWATGYRDDSRWVRIADASDARGAFAESRGVSPVPGLFFVGRTWQTARGSALLLGVGADAKAIVETILRQQPAQIRRTP